MGKKEPECPIIVRFNFTLQYKSVQFNPFLSLYYQGSLIKV